MKNLTRIAGIAVILITSLACNLSQYLSDTPPVEWVPPTAEPAAPQNPNNFENSCIPIDTLSADYEKYNLTEDNSEDPFITLEQILGSLFSEATLIQSDAFYSEENQSTISCAVFSPLKSLEQVSFDFMLNQPDSFLQLFDVTDIEIGKSELESQVQSVGDSFAIYHVESISDSTRQAEFLATRNGETVSVYTFIYTKINNDLSDFQNVINVME